MNLKDKLLAMRERSTEKLVQSYTTPIFRAVFAALHREYPESVKSEIRKRATIIFTDPQNIIDLRLNHIKQNRSTISDVVLDIICKFNIPTQEFLKWRNQSLPQTGYSNYLTPQFYLPQSNLESLVNGGDQHRAMTAVGMGNRLIEEMVKALPYKTSPSEFEHIPWDFFWCHMLKSDAKSFFQSLEVFLKTKKDRMRLRDEREAVLGLFTMGNVNKLGGKFQAVGAKVLFLLPGQILTYPERVIGAPFDNAVVRMLTTPVKRRFLPLLEEYSEGRIKTDGFYFPKEVGNKRDNDEDEKALRVTTVLDPKGEGLFSLYQESLLPLVYMSTNNPLVDPFNYATGFEEII